MLSLKSIILLCLIFDTFASSNTSIRELHVDLSLQPLGALDPNMNLTLTLVTGSAINTQLVASYYQSIQGLTFLDRTDVDLKFSGRVQTLSQTLNTSFIEYKCPNDSKQNVCYASGPNVTLPASLSTVIVGILGLETVITAEPRSMALGNSVPISRSTYPLFIGSQVAQVYAYPSSDGAFVNVGIITLGGYFKQSDLDAFFKLHSLGDAPPVTIVFVDNATLDEVDVNDYSVDNYLSVEVIASVVPNAIITFYFAPNSMQGFYDAIRTALPLSDVVSCSWGKPESQTKDYWTSFETLLSAYKKVPFFVSSGKLGSKDDGTNKGVDFPASCPSAIGKMG